MTGQKINQYKIISALGAGGMGEVYLAEDTSLMRKVALKFLPDIFTQDKRHLTRFEREARAVAALSHPNVCTIHEVIETEDGRHCIVMEYVEGATLRERIAAGRMKVTNALDAAIQIASALSAAHAAGIVHRDIKPENVMFRRDGYVKILDFGLAKLMEKKAEPLDTEGDTAALELKTLPGMVIGTVAYMSPEQARGLAVDPRTDIWSLGVVLYEMVAGRQPFQGLTPTDLIVSIAGQEPESLAKYAPEAPEQLQQIVNNALAKDRAERYQTAADLLVNLKSLRHELEIATDVKRFKQPTTSNGPTTSAVRPLIASWLTPNRILGFAVPLVLLIMGSVAATLIFRQYSTAELPSEIKSLAVLPLENLSGDTSQDYFAEGMTEALITDLAKIGALRVMSRLSVMKYKGARKSMPDIGRELNADVLLIGSVVRSGERVRIAVQLIHASTDRTLWADSYERDLRDVLTLQRELTRDIVGEIKIKLAPQEQMRFRSVRPVNPEAYDHYLRGQFYLHRQNRDDNEAAILALERAVTVDPTFAEAFAELAQAYVWKLFLFSPGEGEWAEKAYVATEKALTLDPDLAVAHLARGRLLWTPANRFPHEKAIREYRRALTLNPSLDEGRNQLALVYCHIGAFDEALEEAHEAVATNPHNNVAQIRIGQTLNFQGKYEQALSVLRNIPPDVNPALVGHQIAWALFNLGRKEEATAAIEQFLRDHPEDNGGLFTSMQAVLAASDGQERRADDRIMRAVEKGKGFGHFHHTAYHIACAYALMKKPEQAIKWLEVAAGDGFPCYPLFERDTNLNNLRQDARFVTLLANLKQQWEHYRTIF
ncbi:MAG TPA: protein kinase [Pyrinomonadaceae bacterium]|nr:protein kinase [Pyrinomonadaceae bacterium]